MAVHLKQFLSRLPEIIRVDRVLVREMPLVELGSTLVYVLVAAFWSVFSDDLFDWLMGDPIDSPALQAMKGINFVFTTGIVLYVVLRRSFHNRRRAEETLRLSQERFEGVALATTDAIWDLNLDTDVIWWSDGMAKLFGYRPEDISTRVDWWKERLHPEDKERVLATIRHAADSGGRTWGGIYRFRREDGNYAVVVDRGYIVRDAAGMPVRMVGGITDITERRRAEEALQSSRRQLRALSARLQSTREEERTNVAREIHDELGQVLTAIKINLDWLERDIGQRVNDASANPQLERVVESAEMTEIAIASVQRIATDLRPGLLDNLGLAAALEQEARRFEQRTGVTCAVKLAPDLAEIPGDAATAVFRIFQESLTNVARHAQAKAVRVELRTDGSQVTLEIEDDGRGIIPEQVANDRSLGLLGMRERAVVLGGDVSVEPVVPHGTRVTLRLPRQAQDTSPVSSKSVDATRTTNGRQ
jgi:two-component system sensor histidine kinase UhpB